MSPPPAAAAPHRKGGPVVAGIDAIDALLDRRPVAVATTFLVVAALTLALLWPHAAEGVLRLLVIALACGYLAVRGYRALPAPLDDRRSPFSRHPLVDEPTGSPLPLRRLEKLFAYAARQGAPSPAIPGPVLLLIREEAERRLAERGRLDLNDPTDQASIRAAVRPMTWEAIRPPPRLEPRLDAGESDASASARDRSADGRADSAVGPAPAADEPGGRAPSVHATAAPEAVVPSVIPRDHLESILDDLERL